MTPEQYCADKAARASSSFTAAFRLLDPPRRRAMEALYAFCREVDDVADDCSDQVVAQQTLHWWRDQLHRWKLVDQTGRAAGSSAQEPPRHPVILALAPAMARYQMEESDLLLILDGVERDLYPLTFSDWTELDHYCDQVAGAVGRCSARVFGPCQRATLDYATDLGLALQYTNILRDIGEDARRGRVYLPSCCLQAHQLDRAEVLGLQDSPRLRAALADLAVRAHRLYDQALDRLNDLPTSERQAQRPGLVMAAIYRDLLRAIQELDYDVLHQRVALSPGRKLWVGLRAAAGWQPR